MPRSPTKQLQGTDHPIAITREAFSGDCSRPLFTYFDYCGLFYRLASYHISGPWNQCSTDNLSYPSVILP